MFTGIIEHCGKIVSITQTQTNSRIWCDSQFTNFQLGESIALNGACLTVTQFKEGQFCCDISAETLRLTSFKHIKTGDLINLERSLRLNDRMGGHFVSGHVDQIAYVKNIAANDGFVEMQFSGIAPTVQQLLVKKGSVAVNGVSLTINEITADGFCVMLIPHTLERTNLFQLKLNDAVNIEFDLLSKLVAQQLAARLQQMEGVHES